MRYIFVCFLLCATVTNLLVAKDPEKKKDALQSIESTRGGRHWIDAKTPPPRSPEKSIKALEVEPGIEVQLVAAEPLVFDPVAITFDRYGRMFVVEYGDYPVGPPEGQKSLTRIVMLEDTNNDGRMDKRYIFADHILFAHSLMAYKDGILVGAQTKLIYLKDTDGDNKADINKTLYDGFKPAHPQMQIGSPRYGLDNWIYCNYGLGNITTGKKDEKPFAMPRLDFRFHPVTMKFGPVSGSGQYGNTIDRWGNHFFNTNRNPIKTTIFDYATWKRNPYSVISSAQYDVALSGGEAKVYPRVAMKSNYLSHAGTHTSACGVTAYLGDLMGEKFQNSVFVCEPIGHLVTRSNVTPKGVTLKAERARLKADFCASTDTWFRPASLMTGPDGALYLADMYRLWVEHPKFLPKEIAARIDWNAGKDRGRIYRFVPKGKKPNKFIPPKTSSDYVTLLSDSNDWRRYLGQQLIVENQAKETIPALRHLLANSNQPLTRLHALWTLNGLDAIGDNDRKIALHDSDLHVRKDIVKIISQSLKSKPEELQEIAPLAKDKNVQVRFQVALALGELDLPLVGKLLSDLALKDGEDEWFATGIMSASKSYAGSIVNHLLQDKEFTSKGTPQRVRLIKNLTTAIGARGDVLELKSLFQRLLETEQTAPWWQTTGLSGLSVGLPRYKGKLGRLSLGRLISKPPTGLEGTMKQVSLLLKSLQEVAINRKKSISDRVAAIEMLGHLPFDQSVDTYKKLLVLTEPATVQIACINALQLNGRNQTAPLLLGQWSSLSPTAKNTALTLMLRRTVSIRAVMQAMLDQKVNKAVIGIDQRVRLLKSRDKEIQANAKKLFGGGISKNRLEVTKKYKAAVTLKGDAVAGQLIFKKVCAKCHKVNGVGVIVGPDISDVRNRSREALLHDILDPNQKVEPKFASYTIVTEAGLTYNGLLASETTEAIILKLAEDKQQIIPRTEIDIMKAEGKSLMPEGVEKEITIQQMADLLSFLKGNK